MNTDARDLLWSALASMHRWAVRTMGEEKFFYVAIGANVLAAFVIVLYVWKLYRFLFHDPVKDRLSTHRADHKARHPSKGSGKSSAQHKISLHQHQSPDGDDNDEGEGEGGNAQHSGGAASPDEPELIVLQCARERPYAPAKSHQAVLKDRVSRVGICAASPNGRYIVISDVKKKRLFVYALVGNHVEPCTKAPLFHPSNAAKLSSAKNAGVLVDGPFEGADVSISIIGFSDCGNYFVVGESEKDIFFVFSVAVPASYTYMDGEQPLSVSPQWKYKLPHHGLVSSYASHIILQAEGAALVLLHDKGCKVEVVHRSDGTMKSAGSFGVGNALCWAFGGGFIAVGGSFLPEVRVSQLSARADGKTFFLETKFMLHNTKKAAKLAMTTPGAPAHNGGTRICVFDHTGEGFIADLSSERDGGKVIATFVDRDFAGAVGMNVYVMGSQFHERVRILLWCGVDISVHDHTGPSSSTIRHLKDIHDAASSPITSVAFIAGGSSCVCGSRDSSKGLRLVELE